MRVTSRSLVGAGVRRRRARWFVAVTALLAARVAVPVATLHAEQDQAVLLRLNPRVGDTLRTWLDQEVEVSETTPGSLSSQARRVTTMMAVHSRTIIQSAQAAGATVFTIVDSAQVRSTDPHAGGRMAEVQHQLEMQRLVLRLGADGSVESARDMHGMVVSRDAAQAMSAMPAVFPKMPVRVGEQWIREMPLPAGGPFGARGSGHARAVFQLDSIRQHGSLAFVSMKGDILPDSVSQGVEMNGTISGSLQLDRSRGWMTDSRFVVLLRSVVRPPLETGMMPMEFITRVTQRLRTMDKR